MAAGEGHDGGDLDLLRVEDLDRRDAYQLLTSLVVPRPIGWISTYSSDGSPNLAPFSFYNALAVTPMMVGVSLGHRGDEPKDSLRNARHSGAFSVNVVTEDQLEAMNETAGEFGPDVDEFGRAELGMVRDGAVNAPFVEGCPAVLECQLFQEVSLGKARSTLLVGQVKVLRLSPKLRTEPGTRYVDPESLRPVARLHGRAYGLLGEVVYLDGPSSGS